MSRDSAALLDIGVIRPTDLYLPDSQGSGKHFGMRLAKENTARQKPLGLFLPNPKLRLREQVREVMRFKHYAVRTSRSNVEC